MATTEPAKLAMSSEDTRIVYGARCAWWGGIEDIGRITSPSMGKTSAPPISIPCCPHCRGMLFEMPSPVEWWAGVDRFQAAGHAGYRDFVEWQKGKCFPDLESALAAYRAKPGRTVEGI